MFIGILIFIIGALLFLAGTVMWVITLIKNKNLEKLMRWCIVVLSGALLTNIANLIIKITR